jgi:hypothetical protein
MDTIRIELPEKYIIFEDLIWIIINWSEINRQTDGQTSNISNQYQILKWLFDPKYAKLST